MDAQMRIEEARKAAEAADAILAGKGGEVGEEGEGEPTPIPVVDEDESGGDDDTLQAGDDASEESDEDISEPEDEGLAGQEEMVPKADYDKLNQSYKVLQGMHEKQVVDVAAENRVLRADVRDLTEEKGWLEQKVEELQRRLAEREVEDVALTSFASDPAIKDLADEYGDDVAKALFKHVSSAVDPLKKEVERLQAQSKENSDRVQAQTSQVEHDLFLASLGRVVPDWEDVNADPKFVEFLQQKPLGHTTPLQDTAQRCYDTHDLKGITKIFLDYKASLNNGKGKVFTPQSLGGQVVPKAGRSPQSSGAKPPAEIWDAKRADALIAFEEGVKPTFEGKKLSASELKRLKKDMYSSMREGRFKGKG